MSKPLSFIPQLLATVIGTVFAVMTVAFVMLPYALSAHPGEERISELTQAFHPT